MTFATWAYSTTLYIILNDTFQALIAFIVPISFKEINCFYDNIVLALYDASVANIPKRNERCDFTVPGWSDDVKQSHAAARAAYQMWRNCSKPRLGFIFEEMKVTRAI